MTCAAILRDALASRGLLRMRAEFVEVSQTATALILRSMRAQARMRLEGWPHIDDVSLIDDTAMIGFNYQIARREHASSPGLTGCRATLRLVTSNSTSQSQRGAVRRWRHNQNRAFGAAAPGCQAGCGPPSAHRGGNDLRNLGDSHISRILAPLQDRSRETLPEARIRA
jgi:hypothetical protein